MLPAIEEPLWMRGFGIELLLERRAFALHATKNSIHHTCGVRRTVGASQLDAFVQRGMIRDTVEQQELKGAEPKCEKDGRGHLLKRTLQIRPKDAVDGELPAQRTQHKRRCEIAIF